LAAAGEIGAVIRAYESGGQNTGAEVELDSWSQRTGTGEMRFATARIVDRNDNVCQDFSIGSDITVEFTIRSIAKPSAAKLAVQLTTSEGLRLCNMIDADSGFSFDHPRAEETLSVTLKDVRLYPGMYFVSLWAGSIDSIDAYDSIEDCLMFTVKDGGDLTMRPLPRDAGLLFWTPTWSRASS
jgi:lipopolysaccharide transport system ATP-binding protein